MAGVVWVAAVALLTCTAVGVVALAALPRWLRGPLVPASPAVGVVAVVLPLTWLHQGLAGRTAATIVWSAAVVAAVFVVVRAGDRLPTARQWRGLGLALGVGVLLALPSLSPSLRAGTSWVVQPSSNNDAVWHVGSAEWFLGHRAGDRPQVRLDGTGDAGPFVWPTKLAVDDGMRRGEPLLQGALSLLTGKRPMATWSPTLATWVALLPGALAAAVRLLGGSRRAAAAAGIAGASSAVLATQVFWQHGPSVVAECGPLPLALGLTWLAPRRRSAAIACALAWAAVLTLYNELLPLYLPVAVVLLVARVALGRGRLRRAARPLAWAAVVGAVAAAPTLVRVVPYLRDLAAHPTVSGSPYEVDGRLAGVLRIAGLLPIRATLPRTTVQVALLLAVVAGVGVLVLVALPSLRRHRARPLRVAALVLAATVVVAEVLAVRRGEAYSAKRVLDTGVPLVLGLGAAVLAEGVRAARAPRWAPAAGAAVLGVVALANLASGWRAGDLPELDQRTVDGDLRAVAREVRAQPGDGTGTLVAVGSYFDEHWLGLLLADRPGVAYPVIGLGYAPAPRYGRMDDVHLVVADDEVVAALPDPRTVGRFEVADVQGRGWSTFQFGTGWWQPEVGPEGPARWMADDGTFVLTGADLACGARVTVRATQPTTLTRHVPGLDDVQLPAGPDTSTIDLVVPAVPIVDGDLRADPPAITGYEGDGRALSVRVSAAGPPSCPTP